MTHLLDRDQPVPSATTARDTIDATGSARTSRAVTAAGAAAPTAGAGRTHDVRIRRARVEDAATVRTLMTELAEHEETTHAVRCTLEDWRRMLADPSVLVLVAFVGDQPVGYLSGIRQINLWVGGDVFAMDDLYVRAPARDRGVGGRLMAALAERVGPDQLLITWGAREDNEAGHRFYRRIGATLRTKVVASWSPQQYADHLASPQ